MLMLMQTVLASRRTHVIHPVSPTFIRKTKDQIPSSIKHYLLIQCDIQGLLLLAGKKGSYAGRFLASVAVEDGRGCADADAEGGAADVDFGAEAPVSCRKRLSLSACSCLRAVARARSACVRGLAANIGL
jgi:hypothetical protein